MFHSISKMMSKIADEGAEPKGHAKPGARKSVESDDDVKHSATINVHNDGHFSLEDHDAPTEEVDEESGEKMDATNSKLSGHHPNF